jgi:hypothetical protein
MIVREVLMFEIKPGRYDDFVSQARELKGMLERVDVGLTSVRLSSALIGGTNSGRVSLVAEYDNITSWATSIENEFNDPTLNQWADKATGPDAAATLVNRVLVREIDL